MVRRACISCGKPILLRQMRCNYCGALQDTTSNFNHQTGVRNALSALTRQDSPTDALMVKGSITSQSASEYKGYFSKLLGVRFGLFQSALVGLILAISLMFLFEEAKLQSDVLITGEVDQDGFVFVPLSHEGGVLMLDGVVNGSLHVEFVVDSGAGDMSIPEEVMRELKLSRIVTEKDYIGTGRYILADGRAVELPQYNIKTITVGEVTALNVQSSVSPNNSPPLLGQTFFKKFKSWRVDNIRDRLYLQVSK